MSRELKELEDKIGYYFTNQDILREALTHGSYRASNPNIAYYERLEFLGDSVLSSIISEYYFLKSNTAGPDILSEERKALICKEKQNQIAEKLEIQLYAEMGASVEKDKFLRYGEFVEAIIGAVFVDSDGSNKTGFQEAKKVIYKLWELDEPPTPPSCTLV